MNKTLFACSLSVIFAGLAGCGSSDDSKVQPEIDPPKRQVSLSFDDDLSIDAAYKYRHIFKRYDADFTLYVAKWPKVTAEQKEKLLTMQSEGYEIGSHSLWHRPAASTPIEDYMATEVIPSIDSMAAAGLDVSTFAYPLGSRTDETDTAILTVVNKVRGFSTKGDMKPTSGRSVTAYSIDAYHLDMNEVLTAMDSIKEGETLYLASHVIGDWVNGWTISTQDLETILNYGHSTGISFCAVKDCK